MPKIIRCQYCFEVDDFKIMSAKAEGEWFICSCCGHITIPDYPSYPCSCQKCTEVRPPPKLVL
jgi:hypothetical protein